MNVFKYFPSVNRTYCDRTLLIVNIKPYAWLSATERDFVCVCGSLRGSTSAVANCIYFTPTGLRSDSQSDIFPFQSLGRAYHSVPINFLPFVYTAGSWVKQRRIKHIEYCRTLQELRGCRKRRLVVGTIWCHFYMKHIFGYCCVYLRRENGGALCRFQRVI